MGKKAGRCNNYDVCAKALQSTPIEADEFNFVCPGCGKPLKPLLRVASRTGPNWSLLAGLGLAVVGAIGGEAYLLGAWGDHTPQPPRNPIVHVPESPIPAASNSEPGKCNPQPLLMKGKRSLYQRILTRPNAILFAKLGGNDGTPLESLQRFYVYERQQSGGKEWLRVGAKADCKSEGWIAAERSVSWKQQITVAFDNPAGRDRVLVFSDAADLKRIAASAYPGSELDLLQAAVKEKRHDERIISAEEPENYVDFSQHPYFLPIVDFQETTQSEGFTLQLLKIHSISKNSVTPPLAPNKAAVVFVIDSTVSMKPYIVETRKAVINIFKRLNKSPGGSGIDFGLVVFRSSIKAVPALEYVSKILVHPEDPDNKSKFENQINGVEEAHVSSKKFDEDSYAGIGDALEMLKKVGKAYQSRHIILVTDAGPLRSTDELSSTKKSSQSLFEIAKDSPRVWLYAMHLKTAKGLELGDHPSAEREYRELTKNVETGKSLYYPVDNAGSIADFSRQIDCLAGSVTNIVVNSRSQGIDLRKQVDPLCPHVLDNPQLNKTLDEIRSDAVILGQALRMEYLGLRPEGGVRDDFEGWIADRDLKQPIRPSIDVRVLLTKNELSNLSNGVKAILEAAEAGKTSPEQFYNRLLDFAAKMGRDSARAKPKENISVADMGLWGEYLNDLPYKSQVMSLDQETWANWSASQQDEFTQSLKTKLERYTAYDADNALWWPKTSDVEEGEKIYPVPLDALP